LPKLLGMKPVRALFEKYKNWIVGTSKILVGISPDNALFEKSANSKASKESKASRIVPTNPLSFRTRNSERATKVRESIRTRKFLKQYGKAKKENMQRTEIRETGRRGRDSANEKIVVQTQVFECREIPNTTRDSPTQDILLQT
jgi:hypothetical protein